MAESASSPETSTASAKPKMLVSGCLMGRSCRYDGDAAKAPAQHALRVLDDVVEWVVVCPEEAGGLPTPRPAACFVGGDGEDVLDGRATVQAVAEGTDVTAAFIAGAEEAVRLAQRHDVDMALLKARSPSCGCRQVHQRAALDVDPDVQPGVGVTVAALQRQGVCVHNEEELAALDDDVDPLSLWSDT